MSIFIIMNEVREERPKYFLLVVILVIFLVTLGLLVYYIRFRTSITPKASTFNSENIVSLSNSYVFASPIRAKANGDLIRVTVFLLDDVGNGIFDKQVSLRSLDNEVGSHGVVDIKNVQSLTDETGKAVFDIAGSSVGSFSIEAFTSETVLPQRVKVTYD